MNFACSSSESLGVLRSSRLLVKVIGWLSGSSWQPKISPSRLTLENFSLTGLGGAVWLSAPKPGSSPSINSTSFRERYGCGLQGHSFNDGYLSLLFWVYEHAVLILHSLQLYFIHLVKEIQLAKVYIFHSVNKCIHLDFFIRMDTVVPFESNNSQPPPNVY